MGLSKFCVGSFFSKWFPVMMVFKRNSEIIPYTSKHHFQLNLTLGRVGKGHSDEEEITGMDKLKLSQRLYIIRIKIWKLSVSFLITWLTWTSKASQQNTVAWNIWGSGTVKSRRKTAQRISLARAKEQFYHHLSHFLKMTVFAILVTWTAMLAGDLLCVELLLL